MLDPKACYDLPRWPHSLRGEGGSPPTMRRRATQPYFPEHAAVLLIRKGNVARRDVPGSGGTAAPRDAGRSHSARPITPAHTAWAGQPGATCAFCAAAQPRHRRPSEGEGVQGVPERLM
jgi:hypothetical protein